jgi:uncharacterized protein YjbI with pentapeptide repeats
MNSDYRSQNLQRHSFRSANLSGVNLSCANLCGADFSDAILDGANFSHADLRGTNFQRSSLIGANLQSIRGGIAPDRSLFFQAILLIITFLLGVLAGFIGSSTTGLLINESKVFLAYREINFWLSWHTVSGLLSICCGVIYGSLLYWKTPVVALLFVSSSFIFLGTIVAGIIIYACLQTDQSWELVGQMMMAIEGSATMAIFQTIFTTICLAIFIGTLKNDRQLLIAIGMGIGVALTSIINANSSPYVWIGTIMISTPIICLGFIIGNRARLEQQDYNFIRQISAYIASYYGTCFDRANLTDANLAYSLLTNTNFSLANLMRTNLYGVEQLNQSKLDQTILSHPLVRNLLVTHDGNSQNYLGCNLSGAYLVGANLSNADFTGANLTNANLSDARLTNSNLTRVLAIGSDLKGATLTGACIADWSIDLITNLESIICDYIYLESPGKDRIPASGSFAIGDFTRLFREVANTVDLIFRHGIDWSLFSNIWQQIQVENEGVPIAIRSIEHKGEGTIVVKIDVPIELDKARFHQQFDRTYNLLLQAVEDRYRVELAGRDRELARYQEQQCQLQDILKSLVNPKIVRSNLEQLVILKLGTSSVDRDLTITVEIGDRGMPPRASAVGILACESAVISAYQDWQIAYRQYLLNLTSLRIDISDRQTTNLSETDSSIWRTCQTTAEHLKLKLNQWLDGKQFQPIARLMLQELNPSQSIQIIIQTDNLQIRQLPFQLWNFFDEFTHAEIAIASHTYRSTLKQKSTHQDLQILAILGNSQGINLELDREALAQLPNARVEFLIEPTRQVLNDKLWEQPWDILFFAGHSASDPSLTTGYIKINALDRLTISELKYALNQSIESGLKLIIINACDGLGLATELISIQLPEAIVMREPVPDIVAQQFLKNFVIAIASGLPVYLAVRSAREQLQGLEDRYPCASWLPVICQNPADLARC